MVYIIITIIKAMKLSLVPSIFAVLVAALGNAWAHPVAFDGATQIQATYMGSVSSLEAYHTYDVGVALGLNSELLRMPDDEDQLLVGLQHNWLVKRWNFKSAQANFYAGAGAGAGFGWFKDKPTSTSAYGRIAIQGDYETLWIYTAAKSSLNLGTDFTHAENTISLGFAPYAHDYDGLATWLIVDFSYISELDDHVRVIPKIRLFKNSWFIEAGCSLDGDPLLSCMIHF
jgi:hypothetical protein